jgi:hypothetical protein
MVISIGEDTTGSIVCISYLRNDSALVTDFAEKRKELRQKRLDDAPGPKITVCTYHSPGCGSLTSSTKRRTAITVMASGE